MSRRKPAEGCLTLFRYIYTRREKNTLRTASTRSKYIFQFLSKFFRKSVDMCFRLCYNINIPWRAGIKKTLKPFIMPLCWNGIQGEPKLRCRETYRFESCQGQLSNNINLYVVDNISNQNDETNRCYINLFWRYIMLFNFILISGIVLMCFGLYNVKHF